MTATSRAGGPATLKTYNAVFGYHETPVRKYTISEVSSYAQHDRSVAITFTEPRKRNSMRIRITPDNISFTTVDVGGETVYDSRIDVPCDMDHWHETNARFKGANRAVRTIGHRADGSIEDSADEPEVEPPPLPDTGELADDDATTLF